MDLKQFVDTFFSPTCIVSVEKTADGEYGDICLAACNQKYIDMIDIRIKDGTAAFSSDETTTFVPGSLYYKYFPKTRSFEDVCYRAAIQKEEVHTYVHLNSVDMWFDICYANGIRRRKQVLLHIYGYSKRKCR